MKSLFVRPLFFIVVLILFTSLACSAVAGTAAPTPTQESKAPEATKTPKPKPTKESPTDVPATEVSATDIPATEASAAAQDFFTEEFDGTTDLNNWTYWVNYGDANSMSLNAEDGQLIIRHDALDTSVYLFYDPYVYTDVILEIQSENRGKNNNNVSLVCRYDEANSNWYEFSIANNGLYWIYAVVEGRYNELFSGGSNLIKQGKDVNIYSVGCLDNVLTLFINGEEVRTIQDTEYKFSEGQVGLNVTSFNVTPIEVAFGYFAIISP